MTVPGFRRLEPESARSRTERPGNRTIRDPRADFRDAGRRRLPEPSTRAERYRAGTPQHRPSARSPGSRRGGHGSLAGTRYRHGYRGHDGHHKVVFKHVDRHDHYYGHDYGYHYGHYSGLYIGYSWPWYYGYSSIGYHYGSHYWGFHWSYPACVAYVPFGFYIDRDPILVREVVYEEVEVPVYVERPGAVVRTSESEEEWIEEPEAAPPADESPEDGPPALDATTEKFLRDGSDAFAKADYEKAAEYFRMAVIASPESAAPRFAFGQALIALGDYPYAARVLRKALDQEPEILNAPGSIVGVYEEPEEFYEVLSNLQSKLLETEDDADLMFLVLYQLYFSGDPRAKPAFEKLAEAHPDDPMVGPFGKALPERFREFEEFPPPKKAEPVEKPAEVEPSKDVK